MLPRDLIVSTARTWVGTPYRHQGRKKDYAIDCVGLILGVGNELGLNLDAPANYAPSPNSNLVLKYADKELIRIDQEGEKTASYLKVGRVAVMWGFDRHEAQHLAVCGIHNGRITMIHAFSKMEKVVEHTWDTFWLKRLVRVYEYPGTEPIEVTHG